MVKRSRRDDLHNFKTQMKLFTAIATAAVIGGSMITFAPAAEARNCRAGTRYHKIKAGGLIFKRTVAEGCFTDYEAAQLKVNAQDSHRRHVQRVIRNANQNRMRQCFGSANVYGNTVYGNSTCY